MTSSHTPVEAIEAAIDDPSAHPIYGELASWYPLFDPPEAHGEEADCFADALIDRCEGECRSLLELGSGGGHNALFMKSRFECHLSDLAPAMLEYSRRLNPECEHSLGDMRNIRLGKQFDAVLLHDALSYLTKASDLEACLRTVFAHTRPGGSAVIAPDLFRENFEPFTELAEAESGSRALRVMEWNWDEDPQDDEYRCDYVFTMRESGKVRVVHDIHRVGLFSRARWSELLRGVGFEVFDLTRPIGGGNFDQVFVARRPSSPNSPNSHR